MAHLVSLETIWTEIKKGYNTEFLEELMRLPGVDVFVFGGIITDLSLGKPWKDIDVRVTYDAPETERDEKILAVLRKYATIVQKLPLKGANVYRVRVPGGKNTLVDVTVSNNLGGIRLDTKVTAICINLKSGEVFELYKSCIEDLENEVIRPIDGQEEELEARPIYLFRTLKLAVKTGFSIDPQLEKILCAKKYLTKDAVAGVISYLKTNGKDSIAENLLGGLFGGFKTDARKYIEYLNKYGLYEEMCKSLQELLYNTKELRYITCDSELFKNADSLEEKLSLFLSSIARSIGDNPVECFNKIKSIFVLDTNRSDGNEFVVDPTKIVYVP